MILAAVLSTGGLALAACKREQAAPARAAAPDLTGRIPPAAPSADAGPTSRQPALAGPGLDAATVPPRGPPPEGHYESGEECDDPERYSGVFQIQPGLRVVRVSAGTGQKGPVRTPLGCGAVAQPEPDGYRRAAVVITRVFCVSTGPDDRCGDTGYAFVVHGPAGREVASSKLHSKFVFELRTLEGRWVSWRYGLGGAPGSWSGVEVVDTVGPRRFARGELNTAVHLTGASLFYSLHSAFFAGSDQERAAWWQRRFRCFDVRSFREQVLPLPDEDAVRDFSACPPVQAKPR